VAENVQELGEIQQRRQGKVSVFNFVSQHYMPNAQNDGLFLCIL